MKIFFAAFFFFYFLSPTKAVTTKMFKVLDTCARYRLKEIDAKEAVEKLKLNDYQLLWLVFFKGIIITIIFHKLL